MTIAEKYQHRPLPGNLTKKVIGMVSLLGVEKAAAYFNCYQWEIEGWLAGRTIPISAAEKVTE